MTVVTLSKAKYDVLEKRARLYEAFLRRLPERKWGVEKYSSQRIREFLASDRLDKKASSSLKKLLGGQY